MQTRAPPQPHSKSQGKGIVIVNKLGQVKRWMQTRQAQAAISGGPHAGLNLGPSRELHVASRYVADPLLIGGKKFDLRLYVLVTSFRPLRVFAYREGFARFCNVKYSADTEDVGNPVRTAWSTIDSDVIAPALSACSAVCAPDERGHSKARRRVQ
jgi:tubulin polyglutamylase TTLL1